MNSKMHNSEENEVELYRHLFAWIGLLYTLQTSTREECDTDIHHMQSVLLKAMMVASTYRGTNPQLKSGFEAMLQSLPQFSTFYPSLSTDLARANWAS
jgi:hypothetical protein